MARAKEMYRCQVHYCGYVYDPGMGDPKRGISPGTAFAELPDNWKCPFCGAHKHMFKPLAGPGSVLWENIRHYGGMSGLSDQEIEERVAGGDVEISSPDAEITRGHSAPADTRRRAQVNHQATEPR